MDPVGPWSTYASYNRLAGVQASAGSEIHHHLPASGASGTPTTTAQLIPGGFLSPPGVAYETVFTPLFHHAGTKAPTHYVTQHRPTKQVEGEYHQTQPGFFEAGAGWQQNSPFGILPHESVVATTSGKTGCYENFNPAHFAVQNHLKITNSRSQSPQQTKPSTTQANSVTFFQVSTTNSNLQQSCIVSSSSAAVTKEYRVPQTPARTVFHTSTNQNRHTTSKQQQQIQTKAQTKIYPEINNQNERQRTTATEENQSFPAKQFQQNYRHYQPNNVENDFQRPKSGSDYPNTNGPDCNVTVPRRPSPLQAHSQPSPLGHAPSPAYPMYNSPMNSISSPQQQNTQVTPPSPLDVSVPRPSTQTNNVAYPSVITRALNSEKTYQERYDRPLQQNSPNCWPDRTTQNRKFNSNQTNYTGTNSIEVTSNRTENVPPTQRSTAVQADRQQQQQGYFEAGHQVTLQDLSSCRGDPMTIVKNLQQTCHVQPQQTEVKQDVKVSAKRRKSHEKTGVVASETANAGIYLLFCLVYKQHICLKSV